MSSAASHVGMEKDLSGSPRKNGPMTAQMGRRNLKVLLVVFVLFGIAYYLLSNFLPYHDDAEIVRHSAVKGALVACGRQIAAARPGIGNDAIFAQCDCASRHFADNLTADEIKPLQTHKEQFAPPFEITPAFQAKLDKEIAACPSAPLAR